MQKKKEDLRDRFTSALRSKMIYQSARRDRQVRIPVRVTDANFN